MARGGWIPLEKDLREDLRVRRMASILAPAHCNGDALQGVTLVLGGLAQLWMHGDSFARDDDTLDITAEEIDQLTAIKGFANALPEDWLKILDAQRVELPGFQEHNGTVAKRRALTAKRVANHRKRSSVTASGNGVTHERYQTRPDQDQTKPDPQSAEAATPLPKARPSKRCPDDWMPSDKLRTGMASQFPSVDVALELEKLRDHTFATARSDWDATFRNWIRKAAEQVRGFKRPETPKPAECRHGLPLSGSGCCYCREEARQGRSA